MTSESEQRDFTRVPSRLDADLRFSDGTEIASRIENVSMRGIFVPSQVEVPENSRCKILLHLGGRGHGLVLEATGLLARRTEKGFGVRFDELSLDAFEHLRNLVVYNSDDPGAIEQELDEHLGIREGE